MTDLIKTATFAAIHFGVAFSMAYLITGSVAMSSALALAEPAVNTGAYYLHEKAWRWGRRPAPGPAGRIMGRAA